jgi:hypothetical protein
MADAQSDSDDVPPLIREEIEWDDLYASTAFKDLVRYRRGDATMAIKLRVIDEGKRAEIWVQTHQEPDSTPLTLERESFYDPEAAIIFVDEYKARLEAKGWSKAATQSEEA